MRSRPTRRISCRICKQSDGLTFAKATLAREAGLVFPGEPARAWRDRSGARGTFVACTGRQEAPSVDHALTLNCALTAWAASRRRRWPRGGSRRLPTAVLLRITSSWFLRALQGRSRTLARKTCERAQVWQAPPSKADGSFSNFSRTCSPAAPQLPALLQNFCSCSNPSACCRIGRLA